jgi:hypothetical protein
MLAYCPYDILIWIFRECTAPSTGNPNDAIHGALVDILYYFYTILGKGDVNGNYNIDVMNYIFSEMYDSTLKEHPLPMHPI